MYAKQKIEKEIARKKKIIEDSEKIMEQVPKHLRSSQEVAVDIYKKELAILEHELNKLESNDSTNKRIPHV